MKIVTLDPTGALLASFDIYYLSLLSEAFVSPDNQHLAIVLEKEDESGVVNIYTLGGHLVRSIEDDSSQGLHAAGVAWTRDGGLIVSYQRKGLYLLDDPFTSSARLIKESGGQTYLNVKISPDSTRVAFRLFEDGEIYIWEVGSQDVRQVTDKPGGEELDQWVVGLDWSPDGKYFIATLRHNLINGCIGRETVIIQSDAEKAVLPDPVNDENFETQEMFPVAVTNSLSGNIVPGTLCGVDNISWRP